MSLESCARTFFDLPTELLILILSYLPAAELCAVQKTCHRICSIVAESAQLQYVLRVQINGIDDLLPPDRPFSERLELLRRHERSWSNMQLKVSHEFAATIHQRLFLQHGYLIYNHIAGPLQYGYVDLLSASPNEELCWTHILKEDIRFPLCVAFAVDHNLAVVLRYGTGFLTYHLRMQHLNPWQDPARLACQAYFPRVYDGRSSSSFIQVHRSAPLGYRPRRGIRSGGGSGRLCPDHSDVRTGCLLLLHRLMEIGHGNPREWPPTTTTSLSLGLPYLHIVFSLIPSPSFPTASRDRVDKQVDTVVGAQTGGHRRQLDNAGKLYQEQSGDLQARAPPFLSPSGTTTPANRVLARVTRAGALRVRHRLHR